MTEAKRAAAAVAIWAVFGLGLHAFAPTWNGLRLWGLPLGYWLAAQGAPILLGLAVWLRARNSHGRWLDAAAAAAGWLSAALLVGVTGALMAQGHDGLAYTLGIAGAVFLWAALLAPRLSEGGLAVDLDTSFASPLVGRLAALVVSVSLVGLLAAELTAATALLRVAPHLVPMGIVVLVIGAIAFIVTDHRRSAGSPAAIVGVMASGLILLLMLLAGNDGAGALVSIPTLADIAALEQGLVEKRLADPALIRPHAVPFLRADALNFGAVTASLALGLALLAGQAARPTARARENAEGKSIGSPGRTAVLVIGVLVLLPPLAAAAKRALLALFQSGVPIRALPSWLQQEAASGMVTLCGQPSGDAATIAKACGKGVGPQGALRWHEAVFAQDGLLDAGLQAGSGGWPLATVLAAIACGLAVATLVRSMQVLARTWNVDLDTRVRRLAAMVFLIGTACLLVVTGVTSRIDAATVLVWSASFAAAALAPCVVARLFLARPNAGVAAVAIMAGALTSAGLIAATQLAPVAAYNWSGSAASVPPSVARKFTSLQDKLLLVEEGPARAAVRVQLDTLARDNTVWLGLKPTAVGLLGLMLGGLVMVLGSMIAVAARRRIPDA